MNKTKIEWCDATWSPISGCTHVSEGCKNCYAAGIAKRFWGDRKFSDVQFHSDRLEIPLKWKKPKRIFICSMADLFHAQVSYADFSKIMFVVADAYWHTFIILTKRPVRMRQYIRVFSDKWLPTGPLKNLWIGCTAENQKAADERIPILVDISAAKRFVSVEPMLAHVDISPWRNDIDWVICGTESGPKRRPAKTEWIRHLRDQCIDFNIPFFLKQREINGKVVKMPELDGVVYKQHPISQ